MFLSATMFAQEANDPFSSGTFKGLKFRNIGPAFTSGRIADIAIHPGDENCWYVAVGSGGVWKTLNAGTTWTPVFDDQEVYSIGCVTIDPNNPHTIWVGTGENVGGRHVGYGNGVYRSLDDGKSWKNMGLKTSEHISRIIVHPEDPDVVFVAAQGPLWNKGGERGLYRTTDGGETWKRLLGDDQWTGVTDVVMDPKDPDWLYAATWQRHRNVAMYIGGGPGSGIHRSSDGGRTWEKAGSGIPGSNLGKIGLAISPFNSDVIYAAVELDRRTGGVFMSTNRGASWQKQSGAVSGATGPHYYQELFASPHRDGTLFLVDNEMQISQDHGKTFYRMNEKDAHVDNHAVVFKHDDPDYVMIGTDGGLYESFDGTKNWRFVANLPVTQYYKVAVDDSEPFYYIYGGTQDNGSHGGPSRTDNIHGIRNADWFFVLGGDGHQPATEPGNPDIVYAESQQGFMNRIDRTTGEAVPIQPQPGKGEPFERYNWDTPILVSPHNPARIYTGSYRVWLSEDRGDSWKAISGDLTRDQERLALPIMGRVQSWDNAWDLHAMSTYNTITSLAESPIKEGLLYAGTDDGLIQVTEDGGSTWRKMEVGSITGLPSTAFVNDIRADLFDEQTVYAALDNHKFGDLKPYLIKSTDAGRSWTSISGDLPDRTLVWRIVQDHKNRELLFAATEFGIYFTTDGGVKWILLNGDVPTISFRDITIQRRENDLVAASFGRGFYILDDISPLRSISKELLEKEAVLFPVKDPWLFNPRRVVGDQGAGYYKAKNPPFGATFSYYLKKKPQTLKEQRNKSEKELDKEKLDIPFPGWDSLDAEKAEEAPYLLFTIRDSDGDIVNHVKTSAKKGINRVSWNLRRFSRGNIDLNIPSGAPSPSTGFLADPGNYTVTMYEVARGNVRQLAEARSFEVKPLLTGALDPVSDLEKSQFMTAFDDYQQQLGQVRDGIKKSVKKIAAMKKASLSIEKNATELLGQIYQVESDLRELERQFSGSPSKGEVGEKRSPTPTSRLRAAYGGFRSFYGPTPLHRSSLDLGKAQLDPISRDLDRIMDTVIPALEKSLKEAGAPWIEGQEK